MAWSSATRKSSPAIPEAEFERPQFETEKVDWPHLVSLDFEAFYDSDYTLSKLSTSEYIRDPRFEALMVGIKIGRRKTVVVPAPKIRAALAKIDWSTHSLLCHHTQFDAFILSHHYGIQPKRLYCTLSMARGLHSNDIGAGLDEVAQFYGGLGKVQGALDDMKGLRWSALSANKAALDGGLRYCGNDVDEMFRIFELMLPKMPAAEMDIIDITCRLFTDPVLKVDTDRVQVELTREIAEKEELLLSLIGTAAQVAARLLTIEPKGKAQQGWTPRQCLLEEARKSLASNEGFASLLRAEGVDPPRKISPAYFKHRDETKKFAFAFSKTDLEFTALLEHPSKRVRDLVEGRLAVKSTLSETRAGRFLKAGEDGQSLPVYLRYYGAHTGRWSAGNRMNMQNLPRGGELRKSILAPKGHVIVVVDSGQIEARVNAWLWGQQDLLDDFRRGDKGLDRDVYCKFADTVYNREITKADKDERFVGKVSILGLGYQMGAPKFQNTLALGAMGPPVYFELSACQKIVQIYRRKNDKIVQGWRICTSIIADMAAGRRGSYGPLSWEKETIWLPNGMSLKYPDLRQVVTEEDNQEWRYRRKGEDAKIYGGLLCLGAATEVLTHVGWKPIVSVLQTDLVWDGVDWVPHAGLVHRGRKETIDFGGVKITPDHEVLVEGQWIAAKDTTHHEATSSFARHDVVGRTDRAAEGRSHGGGAVCSTEDVYDLVDAGPLRRFTVRGTDGAPFIVHNCENLVQALARIIVGEQLLRIAKKYRVVMTTHDEVAALARTRSAKVAYEFMLKQMRIPPSWCADIPLNADGGYDVIYSK